MCYREGGREEEGLVLQYSSSCIKVYAYLIFVKVTFVIFGGAGDNYEVWVYGKKILGRALMRAPLMLIRGLK